VNSSRRRILAAFRIPRLPRVPSSSTRTHLDPADSAPAGYESKVLFVTKGSFGGAYTYLVDTRMMRTKTLRPARRQVVTPNLPPFVLDLSAVSIPDRSAFNAVFGDE